MNESTNVATLQNLIRIVTTIMQISYYVHFFHVTDFEYAYEKGSGNQLLVVLLSIVQNGPEVIITSAPCRI